MSIPHSILIDEFKDKSIKNEKIKLVDTRSKKEIYRVISHQIPNFDLPNLVYFQLPLSKTKEKNYVEFNYYFPDPCDLVIYSKLRFYFGEISSNLHMDLLLIDSNARIRHIQGVPILNRKLFIDFYKSYSNDMSLQFNAHQTTYIVFKIYEKDGNSVKFSLKWINLIKEI